MTQKNSVEMCYSAWKDYEKQQEKKAKKEYDKWKKQKNNKNEKAIYDYTN